MTHTVTKLTQDNTLYFGTETSLMARVKDNHRYLAPDDPTTANHRYTVLCYNRSGDLDTSQYASEMIAAHELAQGYVDAASNLPTYHADGPKLEYTLHSPRAHTLIFRAVGWQRSGVINETANTSDHRFKLEKITSTIKIETCYYGDFATAVVSAKVFVEIGV